MSNSKYKNLNINSLVEDNSNTGSGEQFSLTTDKYNVTNHAYPLDLFAPDSRYGGNYAIFYINVQGTSKFAKENPTEVIPDEDLDITDAKGRGSQLSQINASASDVAIGAGSLALAATGLSKFAGVDLPGGAGSIGLAGTVALGATALMGQRETKRIKTAIALPIPNDLNTRYSMQWSEDSALLFDVASRIGSDLTDAVTNISKGGKISDSLQSLKGDALGVVQSALLSIPGGGSAFVGKANNLKREQIFNGVDYRPIVFNYRFSPRSKAEYEAVQQIIYEFKYHMHPEFGESTYVFIYPSEFDIIYYNNGALNPNLPKNTSCVLRDMNVSYTPNSKFVAFDDGIPSEINMQLTFVELAILTKEDIKVGSANLEQTY